MNKLSREKQRAFKVYLSNRYLNHPVVPASEFYKTYDEMFPSNFLAFCTEDIKISKLPREKVWSWNQSSAKFTLQVDVDTWVSVKKLCPRSRSQVKVPAYIPSFKLWTYHITSREHPDVYFIWVEKGKDDDMEPNYGNSLSYGVQTAIGTVFPESISISSLAFLSPFTDPQTARELGWN